jgi:hypothetical protein
MWQDSCRKQAIPHVIKGPYSSGCLWSKPALQARRSRSARCIQSGTNGPRRRTRSLLVSLAGCPTLVRCLCGQGGRTAQMHKSRPKMEPPTPGAPPFRPGLAKGGSKPVCRPRGTRIFDFTSPTAEAVGYHLPRPRRSGCAGSCGVFGAESALAAERPSPATGVPGERRFCARWGGGGAELPLAHL